MNTVNGRAVRAFNFGRLSSRFFLECAMSSNDLWYVFIFAWGAVSGWAVVVGLGG